MKAGSGIYYIFSCIVAIVVLIFIMNFLGVTWADVHYFIKHGIGGALKILMGFKDILKADLPSL